MSTALDVRPQQQTAALAIRPGQEMWTAKQQAALATLGIKDANPADLAVFMHYCQKTGLDPFSRQIYMISRREKQGDGYVNKQTIQVGIDGFRVIRDRVAARLGATVEYEDTIWYDADGSAHTVWLWDHAPTACNVTVVKDGKRFPGVVRTASYAATNRQGDMVAQWRAQPDHMIEKCAEAFALRRAFPHDLGGIQLDDEVPQPPAEPAAHNGNGRVTAAMITARPSAPQNASPAVRQVAPVPADPSTPPAEPAGEAPAPRATSGQVSIVRNHLMRLGFDPEDPDAEAQALHNMAALASLDELDSVRHLDQEQAARVIKWLAKCDKASDLEKLLSDGEVTGDE